MVKLAKQSEHGFVLENCNVNAGDWCARNIDATFENHYGPTPLCALVSAWLELHKT